VQGTGLRAASSTPGLRLFIDGKDVGSLPQELKELAPGDHKIRVDGGQAYAPVDRQVTIVKGEMLDLGTIAPRVVLGTATFELDTPGAKVVLVSGAERREIKDFQNPIKLATAKNWFVEATKLGFDELRMPLVFEDGHAEKSVHIALALKGTTAAGSGNVATGTVTTGAAPAGQPANTGAQGQPTATTATTTAAAVAGGPATVNFNSLPASMVVLDGRPLGETPKLGFTIPAGNHTALFIFTEQGKRASVPFVVKPGETRAVIGRMPQ
jgi:PEGA domain